MKLTAYQIHDACDVQIRAGIPARQWMDTTPKHFAYLCLPLVMANRSGWILTNPSDFTAVWDGSPEVSGVTIQHDEGSKPIANSHFGNGVITFHTGYVFRTEAGINLQVRGIPNEPKDGVSPLEGIVETDWLPFTFTMNWKITRPNKLITFRAGEPFCMVVPVQRHFLEQIEPEILNIYSDEGFATEFTAWSKARQRFNVARADPNTEEAKSGWSRDYLRGRTPWGDEAPEHQARLQLKEFQK